jgi:clan AA aspartic protease
MIVGSIRNREAIIELGVSDSGQPPHPVKVIIDTGFNGYLTLPSQMVSALRLSFVGHRRGTLADGTITRLDVFLAVVDWHGRPKEVLILQAEGKPLTGMSLLEGSRLILDIVDGGDVMIDELP